jgi:putative peptidoglycan lipid II flippase
MFIRTESYKKGIFLSTVFNIFNKGLVFCNSLIIAYFFGTQLKMDIYFYAFNTIVILSTFITNLNASVLIPESMRLRTQEGENSAIRFLNFFLYGYAALTFLLCLIFLIDPVKTFNMVSGFNKEALQQQAQILSLSIPLIFLMPVVNLLTDIMTSYKFFTIPMIAGIINGLFSIVFVILFHRTLDVLSLLAGLLLSYSLNFLLLVWLMRKRLNWNFRFHRMNIGKRIWNNVLFAQAGNITSSLSSYAPLYLLSSFSGGIITSLNFAQQISSLPTTLITNQFSAVAGIKFNESYARKDFKTVNATFLSTADFLLFILLPLSGILFFFSSPIVSVLLERGAFGKTGLVYTSGFLKYLGLLLPMMVINTLFARLFMASHKIKEAFWYQICFNVVLIAALFITVKQFGYIAYPITLVSVHILNVVCCYWLEKWYFNMIDYTLILKKFVLFVAINLAVGAGVHYLIRAADLPSPFLSLAAGCSLYLGLILLIGLKFNLNDIFNSFIQSLWKKSITYYGRTKNR